MKNITQVSDFSIGDTIHWQFFDEGGIFDLSAGSGTVIELTTFEHGKDLYAIILPSSEEHRKHMLEGTELLGDKVSTLHQFCLCVGADDILLGQYSK